MRAIATLLGGAAGRVTFDDEELACVATRRRAVTELARQRERGRTSRVLRVTSCCAARLASRARAARMIRATIDSATLMFVFEPVLERRADRRVDRGHQLPGC